MKRFICLILSVLTLFSIGSAAFAEGETTASSGKAEILYEANTGQILYSKNADTKLPIASVTKTMSLLIFAEAIDKGKLTTSAICDAIIQDCSAERPRRTLEAKSRQVERILVNSSRAGYNHVLMIEEAHDLSIPTLKYLKRFWELEDGFKKLLAIVLIGQVEMKAKLDESQNWEAREVIRRIEILELHPLGTGKEIADYLDIKFKRLEKERSKIITNEGCEALAEKLRKATRRNVVYSVAYPLLINNWVRRAMNQAAELGADAVDADVVNSL